MRCVAYPHRLLVLLAAARAHAKTVPGVGNDHPYHIHTTPHHEDNDHLLPYYRSPGNYRDGDHTLPHDIGTSGSGGCELPWEFGEGFDRNLDRSIENGDPKFCVAGEVLYHSTSCFVKCADGYIADGKTDYYRCMKSGHRVTLLPPTIKCREAQCNLGRSEDGTCIASVELMGENVSLVKLNSDWTVYSETGTGFAEVQGSPSCTSSVSGQQQMEFCAAEAPAIQNPLCYMSAPPAVVEVLRGLYGGYFKLRLRILQWQGLGKPPLPGLSDVVLVGKHHMPERARIGFRMVAPSQDPLSDPSGDFEIPLIEGEWFYHDSSVHAPASASTIQSVLSKLQSVLIRGSFWEGPETTCASIVEVHAKIPGVAVPRSLTHDGLPKKGSHAGTLGTWKTLGLELRGYFGDFSAAHRRLLTAEVAERLNLADRLELDPTILRVKFFEASTVRIVVQFWCPPVLDGGVFTEFIEAIKSQQIIFFSQFPFSKVAVAEGRIDKIMSELNEERSSADLRDDEKRILIMQTLGVAGLVQAHDIQNTKGISLIEAAQRVQSAGLADDPDMAQDPGVILAAQVLRG